MEKEKKEAEATLAKFSSALDELEGRVRPVLAAIDGLRSTANDDELDAMSRARLHITLCYAVNSLFCMYLRTQGIDPLVHPVTDEITRVQDAFMRMRKVEAGESADHQKPPDRDRRRHIQAVKKSEAKLSALVFPEEADLLRALYDSKKRERSANVGSEEDGDQDDVSPEDKGLAHIRTTENELAELQGIAHEKELKENKKRQKQKKRKKKTDKEGKKKSKKLRRE